MKNLIKQIPLGKENYFRQGILVVVYLILLSIAIRLPFFFPAVINWDESTYILMGQSILDGYLPYTDLWELKPPLAFLFYASVIALLGKSIVSVRIAGAICVTLVSLFTYLVGKTLWNHRVGILGATLFVVLSSLLPAGQATMTQHVALVPLVGALSLLVTQKPTLRILFFAGILMTIASLIRLNLAYVTVIVGFFALFEKPLRSGNYVLQRGLAYASGSCLVIALTYLPYAVAGHQQIWWSSVILAPLSFANSQLSILGTFTRQVGFIVLMIFPMQAIQEILPAHIHLPEYLLRGPRGQTHLCGISALLWIGGLAGLAFIVAQWRNTSRAKRRGLVLLTMFLFGTEISILKGGGTRSHYLIQLVPFMALTAAAFLNTLLSSKARLLTISVVVLALAISAKPIIAGYKTIASRALAHKELTYGPAYEIAAYLNQENTLSEPIYMMTDHIVYWLIDAKPLSKSTTHPSNIAKEYLLKIVVGPDTSTEMEMAKVLAQKPKFIVKTKNIWYLHDKTAARLLLEETLRRQYELVKQIRGRQIYRRI
jgi:hypothetical protein